MASAASAAELIFRNVGCVGKVGVGTFKLSTQQLGWKGPPPNDIVVSLTGKELAAAEWLNACGKDRCLLKVSCKDAVGGVSRFTGFRQADYEAIKAHVSRHFHTDVKQQAMAVEGWSWGEIDAEPLEGDSANDRDMRFMVNQKVGFDVPVNALRQVNALKSDVTLELDTAGAANGEDALMEVRFVVPGAGAGNGRLTAASLRDELQRRAGLAATGAAVARFSDVSIVAPRGKHDLEFFTSGGLKLRGKSQSYVIQYTSIARLFLLEMEKDKRWAIVIQLDNPLRQGKTMHQFIVLTFDDSRVVVELPANLMKEFGYSEEEEAPAFKLVGELLKKFSGKMMAAPSSEFRELHPQKMTFLRCAHKAQTGLLFFCKQSCLFVLKPVTWFRYSEVSSVSFGSGQMRGRSFDLVFNLRSGASMEFTQIESSCFDATVEFLRKAGVVLDDVGAAQPRRPPGNDRGQSAYRTRGAQPKGVAAAAPPDDLDADDPEDEDFEGSSDDGGDGSSSSGSEQADTKAKRQKRGP